LTEVDSGWAANSVNAVVFRKNSLVTHRDTQFIAFYDKNQHVVLGKRRTGEKKWILKQTPYIGNTNDAHNTISIIVDGEGYLHLSWDHHNNPLRYCRGLEPGSLEMSAMMSMTGIGETNVTYPEFHRLPDGDLLFLYRDGASGQGNLVINKYAARNKQWKQLHHNLIDGEGERNAYWQACIDTKSVIHVSWVWRETPDVASNHDMAYACSRDGGISWEKSTGEKYKLPVNAASAEYVLHIPQNSELINQTSMYADDNSNPYITTYWRDKDSDIPQYRFLYRKNKQWEIQNLGFRTTAFSLSGPGTRRIPVSRPQLLVWTSGKNKAAAVVFRDAERANKVSVAINRDINRDRWVVYDLTTTSVGSWEPSYDTELWKDKRRLNLFIQQVEQADAEGKTAFPPQMIKVLEWSPGF